MLIVGVLALALLDSINPSAIIVTLYLLATAGPRAGAQVATYVAAIFVTYFMLGVLMLTGIDALLPSLTRLVPAWAGFVAQTLIGLAMLVYSLTASKEAAPSQTAPRPSSGSIAALVALGVSVTVMELPTAVPYIAAIALITEAGLSAQSWIPLLAVYNLIFVLPPMALLAGHLIVGERLAARYEGLRQRMQRQARETGLWIAGLVGGGLFVTGLIELVARMR